jgi:DNA-binding response OmpR family regulator
MSAILIVDEDPQSREQFGTGLARRGFAIVTSSGAGSCLDSLRRQAIDAIVLEAALPAIDGISLIPLIRRITQIPIIMVSTRSDSETHIAALAAGADAYLAKPVDLRELAARIHSALRRPFLREADAVTYEDLSLDMATRDVYRGEARIATSAREFDLLLTLARHPGRVFTRAQLIEIVWGRDRDIRPGSVETLISELRSKIDSPASPRLIQTIRGVGYALRLQRPDSRSTRDAR